MKQRQMYSLLFSGLILPLLVTGCSSQSPTRSTHVNAHTSATSSNTTLPQTSSQTSNPANSTSSIHGSSSTEVAKSSAGNRTIRIRPISQPSHILLDAPTVYALNTIHVAGQVQNPHSAQTIRVWAENSATKQLITAQNVSLSEQGQFFANLTLPSRNASFKINFGASYPNTSSVSVTRYFNSVQTNGSQLQIMDDDGQVARTMGTNFPILLPSWVPQQLSSVPLPDPSYSLTLAAKSFTYQTQIFQTTEPFPINSQAIYQSSQPTTLATVNGQKFNNSSQAMAELMNQANQQIPSSTSPYQIIPIGGNLDAVVYDDQWHTVVWHEGDWMLVTRGPSQSQNIAEAKRIVYILNTVSLPPTHGVVWVRNINDGTGPALPNTLVSYVEGSRLYHVAAENHIYMPLIMTTSMRVIS